MSKFSPVRPPSPAACRPEAPLKQKLVLVVLDRLNEAGQPERIQGVEHPSSQDLSQEWSLVKPKREARAAGQPLPGGVLTRAIQRSSPHPRARPPPLDYKRLFQVKCFWCLALEHQVARCREPPRCINCLKSGHFARHCRAPPDPRRRASVHSRLTFPKPSISSRLTFPWTPFTAASPSLSFPTPPPPHITLHLPSSWQPRRATLPASRASDHPRAVPWWWPRPRCRPSIRSCTARSSFSPPSTATCRSGRLRRLMSCTGSSKFRIGASRCRLTSLKTFLSGLITQSSVMSPCA
jgi:hypothetical protein